MLILWEGNDTLEFAVGLSQGSLSFFSRYNSQKLFENYMFSWERQLSRRCLNVAQDTVTFRLLKERGHAWMWSEQRDLKCILNAS